MALCPFVGYTEAANANSMMFQRLGNNGDYESCPKQPLINEEIESG